jgi:hypothetical protein
MENLQPHLIFQWAKHVSFSFGNQELESDPTTLPPCQQTFGEHSCQLVLRGLGSCDFVVPMGFLIVWSVSSKTIFKPLNFRALLFLLASLDSLFMCLGSSESKLLCG